MKTWIDLFCGAGGAGGAAMGYCRAGILNEAIPPAYTEHLGKQIVELGIVDVNEQLGKTLF